MKPRRRRRGTKSAADAYSRNEVTVMTPEPIQIPERLRLTRRDTVDPRADELPLLRTDDGRVLAYVEQWAPEREPN